MNKRIKFITAILLTIAMAVSGSCVFAGTDAQPSNDEDVAAVDVTTEAEAPEEFVQDVEFMPELEAPQDIEAPEGSFSAMAVSDVSVNATTVNNTAPSKLNLAWSNPISFPVTGSGNCYPVQVNVKTSGMLWFDAQRTDSNSYSAKVYVGKYDSSTNQIKYFENKVAYLYANSDPTCGIGGISVTKGTYYIGIESGYTSGSLKLRAYVYPYATRTLSANKYMMASGFKTTSDGSSTYSTALFKIKPSKTGYIRVELKDYGSSSSSGSVTILNSKKKAVSDKLSYYDKSFTYPKDAAFGVKKGTTYYLKVTNTSGSYTDLYVYGIKYKVYAAPIRSNTSKSKAKKLKRKGDYIKAAMPANGKSGSQWYKFKVTKKRATHVKIDATYLLSGTTKATVYCGKKKIATTTIYNGQINTLKITYSNTYGKAKKGTYYLKLNKSKKANGRYKIKYLK